VYRSQPHIESVSRFPPPGLVPEELNWYAVHTKSRHEKRVAEQFEEKLICTFLPLLRGIHKWSDRQCKVEIPMFSCYTFVQMAQTPYERATILRTPGVLGFVGNERRGAPIPREQIESLQKAISGNIPCFAHPFINAGMRVRIRGGALEGVEGILERGSGDRRVVVSLELLHRSISIQVEGYDIELV
jgi:transcription antitermination factor NusG